MLRDENVDLRAKNVDIQTDYVILDESYKNFITVSNIDESSTSINRNTHDSLSFERGGGGSDNNRAADRGENSKRNIY